MFEFFVKKINFQVTNAVFFVLQNFSPLVIVGLAPSGVDWLAHLLPRAFAKSFGFRIFTSQCESTFL